MNVRTAREAMELVTTNSRDAALAFYRATRLHAEARAAMERRVRFGRLQRRSRA
jgi:hypothetical protein